MYNSEENIYVLKSLLLKLSIKQNIKMKKLHAAGMILMFQVKMLIQSFSHLIIVLQGQIIILYFTLPLPKVTNAPYKTNTSITFNPDIPFPLSSML